MINWLGRLFKSTCFAWPQAAISIVATIGLYLAFSHLSVMLPQDVDINILLPIKVGLVGVLAAALLSFWGFFWTEVNSATTEVQDLPATARAYRRSFAYFVPCLLLLFVSVGADFYTLTTAKSCSRAIYISFATLGAAVLVLFIFILAFSTRTLMEMNAMLIAGEVVDAGTTAPALPLVDDASNKDRRLDSDPG